MKKGDLVVVWKDFSKHAHIAHAKSDVFQDTNGKDVIFINGISGYYSCTHVRPAKFDENVSSEELNLADSNKQLKAEISEVVKYLENNHPSSEFGPNHIISHVLGTLQRLSAV